MRTRPLLSYPRTCYLGDLCFHPEHLSQKYGNVKHKHIVEVIYFGLIVYFVLYLSYLEKGNVIYLVCVCCSFFGAKARNLTVEFTFTSSSCKRLYSVKQI